MPVPGIRNSPAEFMNKIVLEMSRKRERERERERENGLDRLLLKIK